jgi:hypothetical protein
MARVQGPYSADEVPDEAEIAQIRCTVEDPIGNRSSPPPIPPIFDLVIEVLNPLGKGGHLRRVASGIDWSLSLVVFRRCLAITPGQS